MGHCRRARANCFEITKTLALLGERGRGTAEAESWNVYNVPETIPKYSAVFRSFAAVLYAARNTRNNNDNIRRSLRRAEAIFRNSSEQSNFARPNAAGKSRFNPRNIFRSRFHEGTYSRLANINNNRDERA